MVVARILLVESDPWVCWVTAEAFQAEMQCQVQEVQTGQQALHLLGTASFDLAFISVMKDYSGLAVAERAANQNVAVLLTSGSFTGQIKLQQFGYPCLIKPYSLRSLLRQTAQILEDTAGNIQRVKASAAKMLASRDALQAAMLESERLIAESRLILNGRPAAQSGEC